MTGCVKVLIFLLRMELSDDNGVYHIMDCSLESRTDDPVGVEKILYVSNSINMTSFCEYMK